MTEIHTSTNMVQYAVWPNCNNNCQFCLRSNFGEVLDKKQQIEIVKKISKNIEFIDWKNKFSGGISLLGGELYNTTDSDLQQEFLKLIDKIICFILVPLKDTNVRYSTVTNGIYDCSFLFKVIDKIKNAVGMSHLDINFSYDLKYRYKTEKDRLTALESINKTYDKFNYRVGVQMILTQYLIDMISSNQFSISQFMKNEAYGGQLCFLYPHKIHKGSTLNDFFFKRRDFLKFMVYLKNMHYSIFSSFAQSAKNSAVYKYTGYYYRTNEKADQQPILTDDKTSMNKCGHSTLYQCYSDTDKCMLCDLMNIDQDNF